MSLSEITRNTQRNKNTEKLQPPKRFGVFLLNDDVTTMDFVVLVLVDIFRLPEKQAISVMLNVHYHGKGLCGIYTRDIAETKQQQVLNMAKNAGFPLACVVEEIEQD